MKYLIHETGIEDREDRYLLGRMDAGECSAFEEEMSSDSELYDTVESRRMVIASVQEYGRLRDRLEKEELRIRREKKIRRVLMPVVAFSAAACLAAGVFMRVSNVNAYKAAGHGIVLADVIAPSRGGMNIEPIVKAIDDGNYGRAHALIDESRSSEAPDFDLSTEIGQAYHEKYLYEQQTLSYLESIAFLREGKPGKAKRVLRTIVSSGVEYYRDDALDLLEKL